MQTALDWNGWSDGGDGNGNGFSNIPKACSTHTHSHTPLRVRLVVSCKEHFYSPSLCQQTHFIMNAKNEKTKRREREREIFCNFLFSLSLSFAAFCICTRCDHLLFCQMHKRIYKRSNERMLLLAVFVVVFFSPFRRWYSWSSFVAASTKCKWRKSNIHNAIIPHYYYPQHRCRRRRCCCRGRRRRHQDKSVHLLATSNLCLFSRTS